MSAAEAPLLPAPWDAHPAVLSPVGRPLEDVLAERLRRQRLDGFEPVYSDIVDYILRYTHRIWEEKNVGLCRTHYADSCVMHTLNGPAQGLETVVQGTVSTLGAYADRIVVTEDVIWREDAPGLFHSSHRITSRSTHSGDDAQFGCLMQLRHAARAELQPGPRPSVRGGGVRPGDLQPDQSESPRSAV